MTTTPLPQAGTLVELELTLRDEPLAGVRVVSSDDAALTLSMPVAAMPAEGVAVTVRWPAGHRGRYALPAKVVKVDENRCEVVAAGEADIEQQRHYVRGGGGEQVLLRRPGRSDAQGWIRDISEHSVRAHFADVDVSEGDRFRVRVALDLDVVEMEAVAAKVAGLRQSIPARGPMSVELVAVFTADETQAKMIRRYVLRQQLLTRARTAG